MNIYNSRFAAWIGKMNGATGGYAITIGQTTYYSSTEAAVLADPRWMRHEDRHKAQWREDGFFRFGVKYLWWSMRYGYEDNPYEVDARRHE